jgi:hypothetical protein
MLAWSGFLTGGVLSLVVPLGMLALVAAGLWIALRRRGT